MRRATGLRASGEKVFQTPSIEWISERLSKLREVLARNTVRSAQLLREAAQLRELGGAARRSDFKPVQERTRREDLDRRVLEIH